MKSLVIIPARWNSTRFPGKPLELIGEKPMIQHVWEKASRSNADEVWIATDDQRIFDCAKSFGAEVMMTTNCDTGTDRVIEVQQTLGSDIVVNVQGDEPFINPKDIDHVISLIKSNPTNTVATLKSDLIENEANDKNTVKIMSNHDSGSVIEFTRNNVNGKSWFKHIGIYGYSSNVLDKIAILYPTENAINKSLEQLTWMENEIEMVAGYTTYKSFGIDTPSDLERANNFLKLNK
jgi:3-deoxy-manno-octulosonate cytidylyltransferase (CMP-KDO synthetase)